MRKFKIIALAAVAAIIFYLSNQPASQSGELSMNLTENLLSTIETVSSSDQHRVDELHMFIRKIAHFFVFLLLGIAAVSVVKGKGTLKLRSTVMALGICIVFAILDETHQLFVEGRGAQIGDVFIDSFGAAVGIGLYWLVRQGRITGSRH